MASEWEELESWSKEDLIIDLVKARRDLRNLRSVLTELSETGGSAFLYDDGSKPSDEWLARIAARAKAGLRPGDELCGADLEMYGVDEKTAERFCCEEEDD